MSASIEMDDRRWWWRLGTEIEGVFLLLWGLGDAWYGERSNAHGKSIVNYRNFFLYESINVMAYKTLTGNLQID
jgi:hypothetical protein